MIDESELNALLSVVGKKVYWTAFDLIQDDPHHWSSRPCPTCKAVTVIIGKPFGCVLYAQQHKDR